MPVKLSLVVEPADAPGFPKDVEIHRVFNLAFTGRDPESTQRHLAELFAEGIAIAVDKVPAIIPVSPWTIVVGDEALVQRSSTSGEVELVVIDCADEMLIGVGSDQTDRELEQSSVMWAKQVAPNILAPHVWRWSDVEDHFDELVVESFVGTGATPYQRVACSELISPAAMLSTLDRNTPSQAGARIVFGGTSPALGGSLSFDRRWRLVLSDPVLGRQIEHEYVVVVLSEGLDGALN